MKVKNKPLSVILGIAFTLIFVCVVACVVFGIIFATLPPTKNDLAKNPNPTYDDLCNLSKTMTEAQWDTYFEENLKGKRVKWIGKVYEVEQLSDKYMVRIDMVDSWPANSEISIEDVSRDIALSLNKGQQVSFNGKITFFAHKSCGVSIENATIK